MATFIYTVVCGYVENLWHKMAWQSIFNEIIEEKVFGSCALHTTVA